MVVQFFKGGRTYQGAKSAVKYLLNERVKEGTAKVYEGNPELTLKLIKSINRKWKFTSGVISFEENYDQVAENLEFIKSKFEEVFFASMKKEQYNILYVLHTDKGRAELHFIVPRVELTTGKDLSVYTHKKDLYKKDLFQKYINTKFNLTSPSNPQKQETIKIEDKKWSNDNKEFKKQIHEIIEQGVVNGLFSNREEIVSFLKENGIQVKREGKNYITIVNPQNNKSIRLKGEYYDESWSITRTIGKISTRTERESLIKIRNRLDERVERDATENKKRYQKREQSSIKRDEAELKQYRLGVGAVQNKEKVDLGVDRSNRWNSINISDTLSLKPLSNHLKGEKKDDRISNAIVGYVKSRKRRTSERERRIAEIIAITSEIDQNLKSEYGSNFRKDEEDREHTRENISSFKFPKLRRKRRRRRFKKYFKQFFNKFENYFTIKIKEEIKRKNLNKLFFGKREKEETYSYQPKRRR
jgi:hypothetical protein